MSPDGTRAVDYQVPVNRRDGSEEGKVDLILVLDQETILGERKDEDSDETLLRAMTEIRTYQLKIQSCSSARKRFEESYHHRAVRSAVLFFAGEKSQPCLDDTAMREGRYPNLAALAKAWDVMFFLVQPAYDRKTFIPYEKRRYSMEMLS